jgi:hypothetical protein
VTRRFLLLLLPLVLLILVLPDAARADGPQDQVVISGDVNVPPGRTVGDVVVIDGAVNIAGRVDGDVVAVSGPVRVLGTVDGSISAVSDQVTLLPGARVTDDVLYGDEKPVIAPAASVGGEVSDEGWAGVTDFPWGVVGPFAWWLAVTLSTLVLGIVVLALAPRAEDGAYEAARTSIGPVLGWGILLLIGLPIVAVIALATLVGIPLGIGLLLALLPLAGLAYVTSAYLLGRRLVKPPTSRFLAFLAGWGILRVVALVPFLGTLVWIAAVIVGLGALLVALWRSRTPTTPTPAAGPSPVAGYPPGGAPA